MQINAPGSDRKADNANADAVLVAEHSQSVKNGLPACKRSKLEHTFAGIVRARIGETRCISHRTPTVPDS